MAREDINMDFMLRLLRTQRGNDSIFIIVFRFLKMTHFIPCKNTNGATNIIVLLFRELIHLHSFSKRHNLIQGQQIYWSFLDGLVKET